MRSTNLWTPWLFLGIVAAGAVRLSPVLAVQNPPTSVASGLSSSLPADVYPDSRNRLPVVRRESLDESGRNLFDAIVGDARRLAGLQGPAGIRLHSPVLGAATRRVNDYLRFEAGLGMDVVELAILVTARELNQQFEWAAHEPTGRRAGLSEATIDTVKFRRATVGLGDRDATLSGRNDG